MRIEPVPYRSLAVVCIALVPFTLTAQTAAPVSEPLVNASRNLNYALAAAAVLQTVLILSLSGILRTMAGNSGWIRKAMDRRKTLLVLVPALLLMAGDAHAQAYAGGEKPWRTDQVFWALFAGNVLLFIILMVQVNLLRGLTKAVTGTRERALVAKAEGPSWADRLLARLTRQVSREKEEDILMHHEYDGIHELDNVLPPWWLWLFYGTILWGAVYLVNVHVISIWPDQNKEYANEMEQAAADIAAYNATLAASVDENSVVPSTDPAMIAGGASIFTQYCTPCHGPDAAGFETSVGPNLTDAYWIHGGGAKNIFKTIKYGVPEKGMISWKAQLKPAEIHALVSYIMSASGSGGAGQKAPQGELWSEPSAVTDSTAVPQDSLQVAAR